MKYLALIGLRTLDLLHAAGLELIYIVGGAYWRTRRLIIRFINR